MSVNLRSEIDPTYLRTSRHGKNLLRIMNQLATKGPCNMYELSKVLGCSYALVHKSIRELSEKGILCEYGRRKIERKPGLKRLTKHKHETTLWGLSIRGLWMLILVDENILKKWNDIKDKYNTLLGKYLNYFDLMFRIGMIRREYGYSTRHSYPNPKMVAQALLHPTVTNERQIADYYERAARLLEEYPKNVSKRILSEVREERKTHSKLLDRCEILQDKIENLLRACTDIKL